MEFIGKALSNLETILLWMACVLIPVLIIAVFIRYWRKPMIKDKDYDEWFTDEPVLPSRPRNFGVGKGHRFRRD